MLFCILFFTFEIAPILFCRYIVSMASFRLPKFFSYMCYFVSGMLIHATQNYVVIGFFDDEFKTLFYFVLRIGFAVLAFYFFRGNSEYQKAMWNEYKIIMKNNKDIFDSFSNKSEYYHGYHEGYKQACLRNHVETKEMMLLYPDEFPKDKYPAQNDTAEYEFFDDI